MKIRSLVWDKKSFPPILRVSVEGSPHRRQPKEILIQYRQALVEAAKKAGMPIPYDDVLDVEILLVNPTTPDLDNSLTAFYRAVDKKALKGPCLLTDDGLIQSIKIAKFYPSGPTKYENRVP